MRSLLILAASLGVGTVLGCLAGAVYVTGVYFRLTRQQKLACEQGCIHVHVQGTPAAVITAERSRTLHGIEAILEQLRRDQAFRSNETREHGAGV